MSEDNEDDSSFALALDLPVTVRSKLAIAKDRANRKNIFFWISIPSVAIRCKEAFCQARFADVGHVWSPSLCHMCKPRISKSRLQVLGEGIVL